MPLVEPIPPASYAKQANDETFEQKARLKLDKAPSKGYARAA